MIFEINHYTFHIPYTICSTQLTIYLCIENRFWYLKFKARLTGWSFSSVVAFDTLFIAPLIKHMKKPIVVRLFILFYLQWIQWYWTSHQNILMQFDVVCVCVLFVIAAAAMKAILNILYTRMCNLHCNQQHIYCFHCGWKSFKKHTQKNWKYNCIVFIFKMWMGQVL